MIETGNRFNEKYKKCNFFKDTGIEREIHPNKTFFFAKSLFIPEISISKSKCIQFSRNSGTMIFTNIINNHCPASEVVFVRGTYEIQYCIFDNNEKTLFNVIEGSLQVSHCFISHVGDLTMNTPVVTAVNNTFEKHATYEIDHYNSFFCVSNESPNNDPKKGNLLIWICVITVVIFCGYVIYDSFFIKKDIPYDAIPK